MLDKRISESFDRKLREINCKSADSILEAVHTLNEEELFDLPNEVEVSIYDIGYVDGETEADELEELLSDYLSDTYGFCHFGFNFDIDGDTIHVYNIEWDLSESLNEMALYGLQPEHDSRSSFYNKAIVDIDNTTGDKTLYSYHTPVAKISKSGELELLPKWNSSNTTLRHVKEFLRQNGFKADSLKQITKDYLSESVEEPDVASFVEEIKLAVDPEDIDTHESDLYVKVSPKVTEILKKYNMLDNPLLSKFIDEIDHEEWYEIPFGNLDKRIEKEGLDEETNYDKIKKAINNIGLKEDIDKYDNDFDIVCNEVSDVLSDGYWHGQTSTMRDWGLIINGRDGESFSPVFADALAYEVSYPVRDGYFNFTGLDCAPNKSTFRLYNEEDWNDEDRLEELRQDLLDVGCSEEDIEKFFNDEIEEIEFYIDYDIDIDDLEEDEYYDESLKESLDDKTIQEVEAELEDILKRNPEKHSFDVDTEEIKEYVKAALKRKGYQVEISGEDRTNPNKYHVEYWK